MIALHMIVSGKEKVEDLRRCLDSVEGKVDKTFIVITSSPSEELKKEAEKRAVVVYKEFFYTVPRTMCKFIKKLGLEPQAKPGDKLFQFDKARNYSMKMVTKNYEWLLWLDVDDILRGDLRGIVKRAEELKAESVFLNYIYEAEIVEGRIKNILIEHLRERLIKNIGIYKWEAPIHETLIEQKPTKKIDDERADVLHLASKQRREEALQRNLKNLEYSIYKTKAQDPRPLYYLGKAYFDLWLINKDLKNLDHARLLFGKYLDGPNRSGWAEERAQCWEYLVEIFRAVGRYDDAIKSAHNALIEDERFPSIYMNLALSYLMKKEYDRALFWVKMGAKIPSPQSTLVTTPRDLVGRSLEVIYHACLHLAKLDESWAAAHKLLEIYPDSEEMKNRVKLVDSLRQQRTLTQNAVSLAKYLQASGETYKLKPLVMAMPNLIENNPIISDLSKMVLPPRIWGEKEICIYCGPGFSPWSPRHLEDGQRFVGGSEEAVIYLSQALTKQGWKVTVYADPGDDEGDWYGVMYLPYYKWNKRDQFNIMVAWRRPDFVDQGFKSKKTYVWFHDIINSMEITKERLDKITKLVVLSPWHRTNIPDIPDDKILISSNGINL